MGILENGVGDFDGFVEERLLDFEGGVVGEDGLRVGSECLVDKFKGFEGGFYFLQVEGFFLVLELL